MQVKKTMFFSKLTCDCLMVIYVSFPEYRNTICFPTRELLEKLPSKEMKMLSKDSEMTVRFPGILKSRLLVDSTALSCQPAKRVCRVEL